MEKKKIGLKVTCGILTGIVLAMATINIIPPKKNVENNPFMVKEGELPMIAAHRGGGINSPENTILAFRKAVTKTGVDIIESDLYLTKDGYLVLMHDADVDRTTNGTGNVADLTLSEIKSLNVDYLAGKTEKVPTFEEILAIIKDTDLVLYCHIATVTDAILASAVDVKGVKLVTARLDGMNINAARSLTDTIKSNADTVAVLAVVADGKLNFLACAGADAVKAGAHAGKLVGAVAAIASGKGGGRPDSAMAGAIDVSAVEKALASAADILAGQIK